MNTDHYISSTSLSFDSEKTATQLNSTEKITWFNRVLNHLMHVLLRSDEPKIEYHTDRSGGSWWRVYDPITRQSTHYSSENEIRIWLDKRYR